MIPQFSYMSDQFLGKIKKSQNLTLSKGPSLSKYKDAFKKILYGKASLVKGLGIAKISLKNLNSLLSYPEKT